VDDWLPKLKQAPAGGAGGQREGMGLDVQIVDLMRTDDPHGSLISFYAAGIGVMFLLFSAVGGAGGALLDEAEAGTLERLLSTNIGMTGLLVGKWVFLALVGCAQLTVMFLWGTLAFGLPLFSHVPGFAVMTVATAAAAGAWLLANAPVLLLGFEQWKVFWSFNADRGADLGSLWLVWQQAGHAVTPGTVNLVSWLVFAAVCLGVLVLGVSAPRTPRVAQLAFLVVAGFLLVNKVYSPQYVLWLLPLAVLARPRWRDLLVWQAGELFYFASVWLYLGEFTASSSSGAPDKLYWCAILVRVAAELFLVVMVVRDVLQPWRDPVPQEPLPEEARAAAREGSRPEAAAVS